MQADDNLIALIYEAGALPELWLDALEALAGHVGALGASVIRASASGIDIQGTARVIEAAEAFDREGWNRDNSRVKRRLARALHPGFLTDSQLHTPHELEHMPMYREFLNPRGFSAGAGTIVQGSQDDSVVIAMEAFRGHEASRAAVPLLDSLRPHLARAAVLSGKVHDARLSSAIAAMDATGASVGMLDINGRLVAASAAFTAHLGTLLLDGARRLKVAEARSDKALGEAIGRFRLDGEGTSVAVRAPDKSGVAVLHIVPARRNARDLFDRVAAFAILSRPDNSSLPEADIIAALFDLTPAEARVARAVAGGQSPAELARETGLSPETVRTQLKLAFAKTSTSRQSELASLLARLR